MMLERAVQVPKVRAERGVTGLVDSFRTVCAGIPSGKAVFDLVEDCVGEGEEPA